MSGIFNVYQTKIFFYLMMLHVKKKIDIWFRIDIKMHNQIEAVITWLLYMNCHSKVLFSETFYQTTYVIRFLS